MAAVVAVAAAAAAAAAAAVVAAAVAVAFRSGSLQIRRRQQGQQTAELVALCPRQKRRRTEGLLPAEPPLPVQVHDALQQGARRGPRLGLDEPFGSHLRVSP